jgi:hypothetical protein
MTFNYHLPRSKKMGRRPYRIPASECRKRLAWAIEQRDPFSPAWSRATEGLASEDVSDAVTAREVAEVLGVAERTLREWQLTGRLPRGKKGFIPTQAVVEAVSGSEE